MFGLKLQLLFLIFTAVKNDMTQYKLIIFYPKKERNILKLLNYENENLKLYF